MPVLNTMLPEFLKPYEYHPEISHINIHLDGYTVFHKNKNVCYISNYELEVVKTQYLDTWLNHQKFAALNESIKDWMSQTNKEIEDHDRYEAAHHLAKTLFQS